jgi:hypothetical protein
LVVVVIMSLLNHIYTTLASVSILVKEYSTKVKVKFSIIESLIYLKFPLL